MGSRTPLNIVMTPVRNEAWVLRLFLTVTSQWADYIIIADQMSTDGSREIASEFSKVEIIDNINPDFNEDERQTMLISKAREIANGRDCILWGLDADEIFDAHFRSTEDWNKILNSVPGDVFFFKWAEICPDKEHYWISKTTYYPWMFHDDGKEPHGNYVRKMHSMRIPYPIEEKQLHYVDDFRVLHLAYLNKYRVASKRRFYTLVDWEINHRNPVTLSRSYSQTKIEDQICDLSEEYIYRNICGGMDMWDLVDCVSDNCWMDEYVNEHLRRYSISEVGKLDIWGSGFTFNGKDPRSFYDKAVHHYLHITHKSKQRLVVRIIDKIIKKIY